MKLGLLTAAFPDLSLEQMAGWASSARFEALEIACWPAAGGERRRYAGVSHVDVTAFDPGEVHREQLNGRLSVEHEDRSFEESEQVVKRGFEIARDTLRPLVH